MTDDFEHHAGCEYVTHSDSARRCADTVNLHLAAIGFDAHRRWVAVRLADGDSDGELYDTKLQAVRHQADEQLCAYVRIPPNRMTPCDAESFLVFHRKAYKAGFRLTDPDARSGGRSIIPRVTCEDQRKQVTAMLAAARK